jgi:hypothetical protein
MRNQSICFVNLDNSSKLNLKNEEQKSVIEDYRLIVDRAIDKLKGELR